MNIFNNPSKGEFVLFNGKKLYLDEFDQSDYSFMSSGKRLVATHSLVRGSDLYLMIRSGNTARVYLFTF